MSKRLNFLIIVFVSMVVMSGCNTIFVDKNTSVKINGEKEKVLYTGPLSLMKPNGNGFCTAKDNSWDLSGYFENGIMIGSGYISNYPCSMNYNDVEYHGYYTGALMDGKIDGKGYFALADTGEVFFSGDFSNSEMLEGSVSNIKVSISFQGKEIDGTYSGDVKDGKITGFGRFTDDGGDFEYLGDWNDGSITGYGQLYSNDFIVYFPEVDRHGRYSGAVKNGKPSGEGTFMATNSDGIAYQYDGEWKDGLYDGKGELIYADGGKNIGTFTASIFTPNKAEFLKSNSVYWYTEYEVNDYQMKFIEEHENYFPANDTLLKDSTYCSFVDQEFTYDKYSEYPVAYNNKMGLLFGSILSASYEDTIWGIPYNDFFFEDDYGDWYAVIMAEHKPIKDNQRVAIIGLPIEKIILSSDEGSVEVLLIFASYVQTEDEVN